MAAKRSIAGIVFMLFLVSTMVLQAQDDRKPLSKEERTEFVDKVTKLLNDNYVFPDVAALIEKHIREKQKAGAFDALVDTKQFADVLTAELQSISHDKHMRVRTRRIQALPSSGQPNPIARAYEGRTTLQAMNYGFARVEKMEGNVGYLDLTGFPSLVVAKGYADLAMKYLSTSDALVIDLRRNGGGNPDLICYVCSYLFEKPTHINSLYYRVGNQTTNYITADKVDGKKMSDLSVFVLTSGRTFSGGEEFAYDIQTQKRGTLIGEVTGGGANPGGMFPVTGNLAIFIPTGRAINPITKTNWEGVGVVPEIRCAADKALETALPLAREAAKAHRDSLNKVAYRQIDELGSSLRKADQLFDEKKLDEAEQLLRETLASGLQSAFLDEGSINQLGYDKLGAKKTVTAISIFKYNVDAFPASANVYDSLGEAYMAAGNNDLAIKNYEKSLTLNPQNNGAVEQLKKLRAK